MADPPATRPALVLHAPEDEAFVRGFLLPALGPSARGQPVVDAWDVDRVEVIELENVLARGGVTIAVITPAFFANPWTRLAEQLAIGASVERALEVVALVLEDCVLPLHLRVTVRLGFQERRDWEREARRLRDYLARPPPVELDPPCPYPGMPAFTSEDATLFHGRDDEIAAVLALVTAGEREIYIVGASGSGKSSLIAAGVLPRLAAQPGDGDLLVRTMRPGASPVQRLAACLDAGAVDPASVAAWSARHPGARLVVVVDQLEELFALARAAEQQAFAAALRLLRDEPRCLLVLAVRADFYAELLQSPLWLEGRRRHVDLPPLRGAALRAAIERPARALGVHFEPGLIDRLIADAAGEPGALPLLQETLRKLWQHRRRCLLTLDAYEDLGDGSRTGLAVAISSSAERCLGEMGPAQVAIARRLLVRLVNFGEGRPNTRRRQTRAELVAGDAPDAVDDVLRRLVAARLVLLDGSRSGDDQIDLCHDVLITAWPSFAAWVEARRADEQRRRQIQVSADAWLSRGRGARGLLDEVELAAVRAWRTTDAADELGESAAVRALIDASGAAITGARRRRRRALGAVVGGLAVFAVVTGTLAVIAYDRAEVAELQRARAENEGARAERERHKAVLQLGEQYRELGRGAVVAGQFQRALPYLVAARARGVDDAGLRSLFHTATAVAVAVAIRHDGTVTAVELSRDGTRLVTASTDGIAQLWEIADGARRIARLPHPRPVADARIRGDGERVLTLSDDPIAQLWDVTATTPTMVELRHAGDIHDASFSADGSVVATASDDGTVRLWSGAGAALGAPLVHDTPVVSAELSPDGSRVVTLVRRGPMAGIWDTRTGRQLARFTTGGELGAHGPLAEAHLSVVLSARFSPDGTRVVTASADDTVRVWDAVTGAPIAPPIPHARGTDAVFTPDSARLALTGADGRVRIWDLARRQPVGPVLEHPARVGRVAFDRDGTRLLTHAGDKVVRLWDVASGTLVAALQLEAGATATALGPDGTRIVTASADRLARVWDVRPAPRVFDAGQRAFDAAYSPDGTRIATTSMYVDVLRIWAATGALEAELRPLMGAARVVFDRDGRRLAVIASDGSARIVDVAQATLHPKLPRWLRPSERRVTHDDETPHAPAAAFSPDGRRIAVAGTEHSARVWDAGSSQPVIPPLVHGGPVAMIRFSPEGRRVVTVGTDGTARVWSADSGAPIGPALGHPHGHKVTLAAYSPDGRWLVTICTDNGVRLWDATSHVLRATLTGHAGSVIDAVFSPDGARLVTHSVDQSARIWDVATGELATPPLEHAAEVWSAAWSPDGARLATTSGKHAQIWDVRAGRPLAPPLVHPDFVRRASFSPDGASLLTVARDRVRIWDVGLDAGTLDGWRRIVRDGSFPQLGETIDRLAPGTALTP